MPSLSLTEKRSMLKIISVRADSAIAHACAAKDEGESPLVKSLKQHPEVVECLSDIKETLISISALEDKRSDQILRLRRLLSWPYWMANEAVRLPTYSGSEDCCGLVLSNGLRDSLLSLTMRKKTTVDTSLVDSIKAVVSAATGSIMVAIGAEEVRGVVDGAIHKIEALSKISDTRGKLVKPCKRVIKTAISVSD